MGHKNIKMTKAYEKDKPFLENEKRRIPFHQISPLTTSAVNDTNKNLKFISNKICDSSEQSRNIQRSY